MDAMMKHLANRAELHRDKLVPLIGIDSDYEIAWHKECEDMPKLKKKAGKTIWTPDAASILKMRDDLKKVA